MANMNFGVNILPKVNNTYSLGNSDKKWNLYVNEINGTTIGDIILPVVTSSNNGQILQVSNGAWTVGAAPSGLPSVTSSDNGKILQVSSGTWTAVTSSDTTWNGMTVNTSANSNISGAGLFRVLIMETSSNDTFTHVNWTPVSGTPALHTLAKYDGDACLNSTTTATTENSTKVATTAFVKSVLPSTMTGATSSVAGTSGLVPAPTTSDTTKFLCGDGSWTSLPAMTGATSSVAGSSGLVPAPATTDVDKFLAGDGTYKSGGLPMVILSYGSSTWAQFEAAYNNNVIVYARASSNSNPATGSQTRMAFMAYVNNATTPTEVEFQYYRSMSSHSATAMGDQVFVYKLNKTNGWSVTTRDASIKQIKVDTDDPGTVSWSGNVVTLKSGLPKVTASDDGKILKVVNGAWAAVSPE